MGGTWFFCHVPFLFFIVICSVIAARLHCFGNLSAAVGDRFIAPAYTKIPTKWGTEMCVW